MEFGETCGVCLNIKSVTECPGCWMLLCRDCIGIDGLCPDCEVEHNVYCEIDW